MARQSATQRVLADLQSQIKRTFADTPLELIGAELETLLDRSDAAIQSGVGRPGQAANVANYVRQRFNALPKSFGDRFLIDCRMISEIASECSAGSVQLSTMLMPRYEDRWGHQRVDIVCRDGTHHFVDLILVTGYDDVSSMHLLEYPWLCHEFGHNLHFRSDRFRELFQPRLEDHVSQMRARSIPDRGVARERSRCRIDQFNRFWSPTPNHKNWAHEIAVDIVALWLCGPAYLAAFSHLLTDYSPPPFEITQEHPPYDVRVAAVIDAAKRLGWASYTGKLASVQSKWRDCKLNEQSNDYLTLRDAEIISASVTSALTVCAAFGLPRLDEARIDGIRHLKSRPTECDFGIDVIVAAWLAETELNSTSFDQWHTDVVNELHDAVTREYP